MREDVRGRAARAGDIRNDPAQRRASPGRGARQGSITTDGRYLRHRHHPHPAEPSRSWEGLFLVDTGATDSLAPRRRLEAIGLAAKGQRVYETADGREVKMDVTTGDIEFLGDFTAGRIIMGADDAEPLLGVTALESAGIEVDPVNQRLKRLPALRLKNLRRV